MATAAVPDGTRIEVLQWSQDIVRRLDDDVDWAEVGMEFISSRMIRRGRLDNGDWS